MSNPLLSVVWLWTWAYARRCSSVRWSRNITGATSAPRRFSASTRPCPSTISGAPSAFVHTPIGSQLPNSSMLAAISPTCLSVWIFALFAYGTSTSTGTSTTFSSTSRTCAPFPSVYIPKRIEGA